MSGTKRSSSWFLTLAGFIFLTFNSGMAIYRSHNDYWSVSFVAASYVDLLLLFFCLEMFEKTPRDSPNRHRLKIAVWVLSTFLTMMFSYRVAALMPLAVAVVVWAMAIGTVSAGFYLFFLYGEEEAEKVDVAACEDLKKPLKIAEGP
ncbi:hypothetical protein LUZ60_000395 [Juncus effusus]|nr:hypothetical protein LUZ60_000395 [Juncus effusus]